MPLFSSRWSQFSCENYFLFLLNMVSDGVLKSVLETNKYAVMWMGYTDSSFLTALTSVFLWNVFMLTFPVEFGVCRERRLCPIEKFRPESGSVGWIKMILNFSPHLVCIFPSSTFDAVAIKVIISKVISYILSRVFCFPSIEAPVTKILNGINKIKQSSLDVPFGSGV